MARGWSEKADEHEAVDEAVKMMRAGLADAAEQFVVVFTTGKKYDGKKVFDNLASALKPGVRIWGLNSDVSGISLSDGMHSGLAIMGFSSSDMVVGVGTAPLQWKDFATYKDVGKTAINAALQDAGKQASESPNVLFFAGLNLVTDTEIFRGIAEVVGNVPICGGNAGQHAGELQPGDGYVLSTTGAHTDTISVAAVWVKSKVGVAFGYGYTEHPEHTGIVTKADPEKRRVYEIDHRPAADVYNEWTGGLISDLIAAGGGIVPLSVVGRFEVKKQSTKGSVDYVEVGFTEVYPDKSVFVTHEPVEEGTQLTLMELASESDLINKPAIVAATAGKRGGIEKEEIAGAIVVYCYALLYTAQGSGYNVNAVFPLLSQSLGDAPLICIFSGGEIGHSPHFKNEGNRMMAFSNVVAVFGKK